MSAQSLPIPDKEGIHRQLERILGRKTFRGSTAPANLLRFTVEETLAGRSAGIKEYTLGSQVLGRGNRFDPKLDTIVRVQFRRLRAKLDQYYAGEGKTDPILIAFEKGGYVPEIRLRGYAAASQATPASIAVLPFAEASGNPDEAYFGEGLAEELIHGLSRLPALKVVARTSAFQFRGGGADVREIGSRLGVETIMEGSVRSSGEQLRLSVRLINAVDGFTVWSSVYERRIADIFAVQDELAQAIISALSPRLGTAAGQAGRPRSTRSVEVYRLYLRGRHQWNQLGPESLQRAIECFRKVIAQEPSYAPAHAGLADCYIALAGSGYTSPNEVMPKARQAAAEAVALDPTLGEAHTSLAKVTEDYEWRLTEAESIYLKAIELSPGYATAHYWYGMYLLSLSRHTEALCEVRTAQELDPLSPMINWAAGMMLEIQGKQPEVREQYWVANDLIPRNPDTLRYLMLGAARKGRYGDFERALRTDDLAHDDVISQIVLAGIHGVHGRTTDGLRLLERVEGSSTYVPPIPVSTAYLTLGQTDRAQAWLEEAFVQRDSQLLWLGSDPVFEPLRANPWFQRLLERIAAVKQ
jgi:serine/threonine-protein kinase